MEKSRRWNDNINTAFKDFTSGSVYRIHLIQDGGPVAAIIKLCDLQQTGYCGEIISLLRRNALLYGVF